MQTQRNYSNRRESLPSVLASLDPPILIVSTIVGRGMYSIGEAVTKLLIDKREIYHVPIEKMLSKKAVNEDFSRYKFISDKFPFLLYLIYKIPIFYYRKLFREKIFKNADLKLLKDKISSLKIKSVICISHRPAFWLSALKKRKEVNFKLWGLSGEYGRSLGWKHIFWEVMDGYLSPLEEKERDFPFPSNLHYVKIELPVRSEFHEIAKVKGDINKTLLVAGFWGQSFFNKIINSLHKKMPHIQINVVCGENEEAFKQLNSLFKNNLNIIIHGEMDTLAGLMGKCASVITKPGISTLLEAHAAKRTIFLLKGMPVAEDHNAQYAIKHFGAQWFSIENFLGWYNKANEQ